MPFPVPDFHLLYVDVPTEKWGGARIVFCEGLHLEACFIRWLLRFV